MKAWLLEDELVTRLGFSVDLSKLRSFERGVGRTRQKLEALSGAAFRIGTALTGAATGAVIGFAAFESELAKIRGLVGVSQETINSWKDDLTAISRETGQAPVELAKALFFVTSAGLRGSAAIDILRQSARASAAGLGEQTTIVDLLTSAMNAYGPEVLSATKATDSLTEAVRLGKLEPASLAGAMGRVLPIASAMGVQFNEVAGLLAAMSRTGTTAEEGVTQLNAVMNGILNPAQGAEKALAGVGLTFANLRKVVQRRRAVRGLADIADGVPEQQSGVGRSLSEHPGVARRVRSVGTGTRNEPRTAQGHGGFGGRAGRSVFRC